MAREVEPFSWCVGGEARSTQVVGQVIVSVSVHIQEGVPERATVGLVMEDAEGEDVGVGTGGGVHCV